MNKLRAFFSDYVRRPSVLAHLKKPQEFGWQEAAALGATVLITLVIFIFQGKLTDLDELGYAGAFLAMVITSATLVMPTGGLIIIFVLGGTLPSPWLLAVIAGIGSALGEFTGYLAGYSGHKALARTKLYKKTHERVANNAIWTIAFLAAVPSPLFDLAGIAAGAMRLPWWKFFFPTAVGKILKMIVVALAGFYSVGWIERLL